MYQLLVSKLPFFKKEQNIGPCGHVSLFLFSLLLPPSFIGRFGLCRHVALAFLVT